ncbi:GrpB family nucleotidyltransferase [Candidatus Mancarchaeum acidiphilum]|uniref:GrpB family nucleotidyltransferase n=1 Tax=Candidatus Mancarchaeum acidiphilum TaxID=1920749 RepID=A0A218NNX8_9ARCH|nr:GrpB family protein [Candidatus Mancarchaeum acidiphilum]ASI14187.1 GrpB family nucleotidyltransferase [Candidatus Mancarchaeum acidiphilum]
MHHKEIDGKQKYVFKRYSPIYNSFFAVEQKRIYENIGRRTISIEHIGSTAVPDLGGKNILDIIIGIKVCRLKDFKELIKDLGYDFIEDSGTKRRLFFVRDTVYKGKNIRTHLHLVKFDKSDWKQKIAFRDYLIKHKNARIEYANVKKKAVKAANGNKEIYMKEKESFIKGITKKALKPSAERINKNKHYA